MKQKQKSLKETLLFERTFEVIKIGLYSSRVSHFSLEIFGFVWYVNNSTAYVTLHNDFLGNQKYRWGCRTKSLKTVHVCMYPLALTQQTLERFNGIISKIYLIPNNSLCSVTYAVELFTYQTNPKQTYLLP